jgi:hypothetical protein
MEPRKEIIETSEFTIAIYSIHDDFTKEEIGVEFCLAPQPTYYDFIDHLFFLKVVNEILLVWLKRSVKATEGTSTIVGLNILNKRIVEPTNRLPNSDKIFSEHHPYLHGKFEKVFMTINEKDEYVNLSTRFSFGDIGKITYEIRRE